MSKRCIDKYIERLCMYACVYACIHACMYAYAHVNGTQGLYKCAAHWDLAKCGEGASYAPSAEASRVRARMTGCWCVMTAVPSSITARKWERMRYIYLRVYEYMYVCFSSTSSRRPSSHTRIYVIHIYAYILAI